MARGVVIIISTLGGDVRYNMDIHVIISMLQTSSRAGVGGTCLSRYKWKNKNKLHCGWDHSSIRQQSTISRCDNGQFTWRFNNTVCADDTSSRRDATMRIRKERQPGRITTVTSVVGIYSSCSSSGEVLHR